MGSVGTAVPAVGMSSVGTAVPAVRQRGAEVGTAVPAVRRQHSDKLSGMCVASPPPAVSLYFALMSSAVSHIV